MAMGQEGEWQNSPAEIERVPLPEADGLLRGALSVPEAVYRSFRATPGKSPSKGLFLRAACHFRPSDGMTTDGVPREGTRHIVSPDRDKQKPGDGKTAIFETDCKYAPYCA